MDAVWRCLPDEFRFNEDGNWWFHEADNEREIGASGIGTMAAARVTPSGRPHEALVAVSMYARWMRAHPSAGKGPGFHADLSAHCILSDLSTFIDYADLSRHRILAAGDLNLIYTTTAHGPYFRRERAVWYRFEALGLEFLGPQAPNGRQPAAPQPGTSADTKNVLTYAALPATTWSRSAPINASMRSAMR